MGVVEDMVASMMGGGNPNTSRLQNVLMGRLGTGHAQGQLAGDGPQPGAGVLGGGLRGLVGLFEQNGLGPAVQSWIGQGPNAAVSPADLQRVFGGARVDAMAEQAGMPARELLEELARHLPGLVDGMTPDGRLPAS